MNLVLQTLNETIEFLPGYEVEDHDNLTKFADQATALAFLHRVAAYLRDVSVLRNLLVKEGNGISVSQLNDSQMLEVLADRLRYGRIKVRRTPQLRQSFTAGTVLEQQYMTPREVEQLGKTRRGERMSIPPLASSNKTDEVAEVANKAEVAQRTNLNKHPTPSPMLSSTREKSYLENPSVRTLKNSPNSIEPSAIRDELNIQKNSPALEEPLLPISEFANPLEEASPFGTHIGKSSGRPFSPEELGLPMQKLTTRGVEVTPEGVANVKMHTDRFGEDSANAAMIQRLEAISRGEMKPTFYDINYYTHELRELQHYEALGYQTGVPENPDVAHQLWNNTHTATLEEYGLTDTDLYFPEI